MTVYIAQCLCPSRHCIMATADEAATEAEALAIEGELRARVIARLADGTLNPWCGLCHAWVTSWRYELGRTQWASMAEALPHLRQSEAEQIATAATFGDLPRSD